MLLAIKHPQHPPLYSIYLIFKDAWQKSISSTVISKALAAWNLSNSTVSPGAVAQLACQLN